ncbi:MAG: GntR family transcriptional regulator [Planctomycetes bacterium]|nr:GntR family transcriptional regulator [Planctomycetota bacterium]
MPREPSNFDRLDRPLSLTARVEKLLRQSITEGKFPGGKLPTEVELAEQLGVSRETVRLAAENLQREGLLVKVRRKGTFTQMPRMPDELPMTPSRLIGYLQAGYKAAQGQEEAVSRVVSGLMLQGAVEEASEAGCRIVVQHAAHTQVGKVFQQLHQESRLRGVIFASYGEEKLLKRVASLGLPIVLLDHDLHLSGIHSVRDDSFQGAHDAVLFLAGLGHRRIAYVNWRQVDLNPWRLRGYRDGLRDAGIRRQVKWEISVELTQAGGKQAFEAFSTLTPRPTALYCFNNTLAKILIEELTAQGFRVPDDVSVVGGGGEYVPGLTCHQTDWYDLGRSSVRVLMRTIDGPAPTSPEHHLGPHVIREGETTSAVEHS